MYRKIGTHRVKTLPDTVVRDNTSPRHVDIDSLYPGQTYRLNITLFYEHVGKKKNYTVSMTGTVRKY